MAIILAVLLLALILGGLGFAVHVLWWIALIVLVLWLLGFFFTGAGTGGRDRKSTRLNSSHIQKYRMPSSA